ncbi:hypothetical protein EVG20_g9596 [Dentipellis fragilis]|uniref:Uncharacterized protein n=1 Tax=Dentipellis fragilis TaxID=205917 RepID=A0A4Y9XX72_9AGAM|nr:hypothetical protein EVG20_g9596 [Dentipellis fragilis]
MASQAARLAHRFTPEYACRINAQLVHPAQSQLVKPNELESALARPLHVSAYEPKRNGLYLAATVSYGLIAFFIANEYLRAQGLPGLVHEGMGSSFVNVADRHIDAAAGRSEIEEFAEGLENTRMQPGHRKKAAASHVSPFSAEDFSAKVSVMSSSCNLVYISLCILIRLLSNASSPWIFHPSSLLNIASCSVDPEPVTRAGGFLERRSPDDGGGTTSDGGGNLPGQGSPRRRDDSSPGGSTTDPGNLPGQGSLHKRALETGVVYIEQPIRGWPEMSIGSPTATMTFGIIPSIVSIALLVGFLLGRVRRVQHGKQELK